MSLILLASQLIFSLILFLLLFLSFGLGVVRLVGKDWKLSLLGQALAAIFLSFSAYASIFFFLGSLLGPKVYYLNYLFLVLGLANFKQLKLFLLESIKEIKKNKLLSFFTVFCFASFYLTVAFSGVYQNGDLVFQPGQMHDSLWHVALIKNLKENIPPVHPASFEHVLTGYHYFYDLVLASWVYSFNLDSFLLYFQVFSLVVSLLLALAAVYLAQSFKKKNLGYLLLFFTFFVGSFAQFIPYFVPGQAWNDGSFWVSQTFTMLVNPQLIYSLALLYFLVASLKHSEILKKTKLNYFLILSFLVASSVSFKSYGFVIMSVLLGSFLGLKLLLKRQRTYFISLVLFLILAAVFFLSTNKLSESVFFYQPFWYTTSMIESPDRVNYPLWKILEQHYILHHNWARVYEIWTKEFLIFFFGNLGTRSFAIFLPLVYLLKKRWPSSLEISIFLAFLFSSFFPLFFLQKGIVWNSIQFWYYALILANIFAALFFWEVFSKYKNKLFISFIVILLLVISLPTYLKNKPGQFIASEKIDKNQLEFIQNLNKKDKILICPTDGILFKTSSIEALTSAQVYFANPVQLVLVGIDAQTQEKDLQEIFTQNKFGNLEKILQENDIDKIICEKKNWLNILDNYSSKEIINMNDWQMRILR